VDHTVFDTGRHRLSIGTITVTPANDRYRPVHWFRANGRSRRIPVVPEFDRELALEVTGGKTHSEYQ
jgi:hypothetical protein